MIIILHYILFNAGMPATIILLPLYLQTYSQCSLAEIGCLLMVLPFLSMLVKPVVCALADRKQAHKQFLMGAMLLMALGYGSLAVAPFFPAFLEHHGRLVWYLDVVGVVVGNMAFGVAWSLGDALAVQRARVKGIPWGAYRVWATIAWGVFGFLDGQINELPSLPTYVPAFLVLIVSSLLHIFLCAIWTNKDFDMRAEPAAMEGSPGLQLKGELSKQEESSQDTFGYPATGAGGSIHGTLTGSARMNPRLMGALANIVMDDIHSTLKSSLKLGPPQKRLALADILEQHQLSAQQQQQQQQQLQQQQPQQPQLDHSPVSAKFSASMVSSAGVGGGGGGHSPSLALRSSPHTPPKQPATLGKSALRRTQMMLSRMNSLSSASGHAIVEDLKMQDSFVEQHLQQQQQQQSGQLNQQQAHQQMMVMSSVASNASLSKAAAARALGFGPSSIRDSREEEQASGTTAAACGGGGGDEARTLEGVQLVLLKLIIKRDISIHKYLAMFTLFGFLLTAHLLYFFMHVESICKKAGLSFSEVQGYMCGAQSVSEIFTFLVLVPYYMPLVGRTGSFLSVALIFLARYAYYATYFTVYSPYWALATETCHGFAYGIAYSLITEIATECVDQVDKYMPELIARGLIHRDTNTNLLKLPLRATMQGLFSGAFDGLGNGLAALFGGFYLAAQHDYTDLWAICAHLSLAILLLYSLIHWRDLCPSCWLPAKGNAQKK